MALAEVVAFLRLNASQFTAEIGKAEAQIDHLSKTGATNMEKMSAVGKAAFLGIGAGVVAVGVAAVDFGEKQALAQSQLQAALKASGESWDKVKGSVAATGAEAQHYGFTQAQVDAALTQGVISTQNYGLAHRNLAVAVQLAAARHIDLSTAMQLVDKAATGQTRALKQMGIDLPVVASNALKVKQAQDAVKVAQLEGLAVLQQYPGAEDAASSHHAAYEAALNKVTAAQGKLKDVQSAGGQILDALSKRLSGQAAAAADSFSGRLAAARAQGENMAAAIGVHLIPILERLMSAVMAVVNWLDKHKAVAEALAIIIGTVMVAALTLWAASAAKAFGGNIVSAIKEVALAFQFLTGAELEADAAADANPFGAIVLALVALGAAVYEVIKHWSTIEKFFKSLWNDIKKIFDDAFGFIKSHLKDFIEAAVVIVTGGAALIPVLIFRYWSQIEQFTITAWNAVVNFISSVPSRILGVLTGLASAINTNVIQPVVNFFKGLPNRIVEALGAIVSTIWQALVKSATWIDTNVLVPVVNYFKAFPARVVTGLGAIVSTIWQALIQSATWINSNVLVPVVNYFTQLPGRIVSGLGDIVSTIWAGLTSSATWIDTNVIQPIVSKFTAVPGLIYNAISSGVQAAANIAKSIINGIIGLLNQVIDFYDSHRPSLFGISLLPSVPDIPKLAEGGFVTTPTIALIGEQGPEYVIPASLLKSINSGLNVQPIPTPSSSATGGASTPPNVEVILHMDSTEVARALFPGPLWTQMLQNKRSLVDLGLS